MENFLNRIFDSLEEAKKDIGETKVGVAQLDGKIKLLDSKMSNLATSEELIKSTIDMKDFCTDSLIAHEEKKHKEANGKSIKLTIPLKIAGISGGGFVLYYFVEWLLKFLGQ